jgi:predicted DNA-binding transcriptional regulator AlpA
MSHNIVNLPQRHYLDRRADRLAEEGRGAPDDLLTTPAVADWLGVSRQWLEIGRNKGYGPKFVKLNPKRVRYRREDVLTWLKARTLQCVSEYRED